MRAVQDASLRLFEELGFEAVTVEQVAAAAAVSPSTVYRHFKTKERLVLWDEIDDRLDAALTRRLGKGPAFQVLREVFVELYGELNGDELALQRRRGALIDAVPQLQAAMAGELERARVELQNGLARVCGAKRDDLQLELTARIALSALIAGFESWQRAGPKASLPAQIERAFDAASRVLDGPPS